MHGIKCLFPLPHRDFSKISKINLKPFLTTSFPSHYQPENPPESVKEDYFGQILSFFQQRNWKKILDEYVYVE
jgi:hypothetical protein